MGILRDTLTAYSAALDQVDKDLDAARPFDKKTDELMRFALSSARARIHLGWSALIPVADGIAAMREDLIAG